MLFCCGGKKFTLTFLGGKMENQIKTQKECQDIVKAKQDKAFIEKMDLGELKLNRCNCEYYIGLKCIMWNNPLDLLHAIAKAESNEDIRVLRIVKALYNIVMDR